MKKLILAAAAAALFVSPALATQTDFGAVTCSQTKTWDANTAGNYLMWLDGYLAGKTGDTVLDTDAIAKLAQALDTHCNANPDDKILDVVNAAMEH